MTTFAHAHCRIYEEHGEHTAPIPPGLTIRRCWTRAAPKDLHRPGPDLEPGGPQTVLPAPVPLDDDGRESLAAGKVVALRDGEVLRA